MESAATGPAWTRTSTWTGFAPPWEQWGHARRRLVRHLMSAHAAAHETHATGVAQARDVADDDGPGARHHHGRGPWGWGGPGAGRRGFAGPPFMPPWFGGPGGPGGRGRPRSRRGDVRLAVLALLNEQPMHGYQIITELAARTGGVWQPSPGSIYPTLQQLEDEGLVTVAERDGRRTFSLTAAGRAEVARAPEGRRAPWEEMAAEADDEHAGLRTNAMQLMAAVMQVGATGTPAQLAHADRLLAETRRALYRLLADDEPDAGSADDAPRGTT